MRCVIWEVSEAWRVVHRLRPSDYINIYMQCVHVCARVENCGTDFSQTGVLRLPGKMWSKMLRNCSWGSRTIGCSQKSKNKYIWRVLSPEICIHGLNMTTLSFFIYDIKTKVRFLLFPPIANSEKQILYVENLRSQWWQLVLVDLNVSENEAYWTSSNMKGWITFVRTCLCAAYSRLV